MKLTLIEEQPPDLPDGYLIVTWEEIVGAEYQRFFAAAKRRRNGYLIRIHRSAANYDSIAGALASARMHASRLELKGKKLGLRTGDKRRRAGGHGYTGGDGFVEI